MTGDAVFIAFYVFLALGVAAYYGGRYVEPRPQLLLVSFVAWLATLAVGFALGWYLRGLK